MIIHNPNASILILRSSKSKSGVFLFSAPQVIVLRFLSKGKALLEGKRSSVVTWWEIFDEGETKRNAVERKTTGAESSPVGKKKTRRSLSIDRRGFQHGADLVSPSPGVLLMENTQALIPIKCLRRIETGAHSGSGRMCLDLAAFEPSGLQEPSPTTRKSTLREDRRSQPA